MMKKLSALLLALVMVLGTVVACSKPGTSDPGTTDAGDPSDLSSLPADQVLELVAGGASEYLLVRGDTAESNEKTAVSHLRAAVKELTGVEMKPATDWLNPGEEIPVKEILIGKTTREETKTVLASLKESEFAIRVVGEKLVIVGSDGLGTLKAVDYFIANYVKAYQAGNSFRVLRTAAETKGYDTSVPHTIVKISKEAAFGLGGSQSDSTRLCVCLQGLLNRRFKETDMLVYVIYDQNGSQDTFWLNYMVEKDSAFEGYEIFEIKDAKAFYDFFLPFIKQSGIVLWDPDVPATSNVATTICGVDGYLPVVAGKGANDLQKILEDKGVEVKMNLVNKFGGFGTIEDTDIESTGSTKCDAYLWALEKYMDKCSDELIGYVLDGAGTIPTNVIGNGIDNGPFNNQVFNHDYLVMKKAFCFDLTPNATETPCDDKEQPKGADRATLIKILNAAYEKADGGFTQVLGFPPWWVKYTRDFQNRGNKGGVELEWEFAQLASTYNCAMEADCAHPCCMVNGSAYTNYPIADHFENNKEYDDTLEFDKKTRYFTVYIGDYDSGAWMRQEVPNFWKDPARGTYPLAWGFNPQLSVRMPVMFEYIYKYKTPNDYFITGDSGCGYVNPAALIEGQGGRTLPTALEEWIEYNEPYLKKFDMDICGFILNGALTFNNKVFDTYSQMTPTGCFSNNSSNRLIVCNGTPITGMWDYQNPEQAYNYMKDGGKINFSSFRTVRYTPTKIVETIEAIEDYANGRNDGYTYQYVGPYEFFDLIQQSGQGKIIDT